MYLTREEERILSGYEGEAKALAIKTLVKVGEALGAERLIPIKHAHVSGISYGTIGEHGLALLEELVEKGARVEVPTTVNPIGFDSEEPSLMSRIGVRLDDEFVKGQMRIVKALRAMGAQTTLTCTPYYLPDTRFLKPGDSVSWGESSAILYGNSVIGIRTNREGGPLALMSAIVGKTYYWGLHIDENRKPTTGFKVDHNEPLDEVMAGLLGKLVAERYAGVRPPYVKVALRDELAVKEMLAAVGAAGSLAMIYLDGITGPSIDIVKLERFETIDWRELASLYEEHKPSEKPDVVFLGCPHSRAEDLARLAKLLEGKPEPKSKIVITLSRSEYRRFRESYPEYLGVLKEKAVIVRDTCLIVSPFGRDDSGLTVVTNSYKAYFYLSKRGLKVGLSTIEDMIPLLYM
ncbi:MAG: aconitase X catalytic domain-containing protein [Desulfurococcales archaeon]|nr:aconitase X catalytic domain-containing protein [Desulfurococcales archaeon]